MTTITRAGTKRIQQCGLAIKNTDRNFPPLTEQQLSERWIPREFSHELFSPHRRNATFHCSSRFLSSLYPHTKTVSRSISLTHSLTLSLSFLYHLTDDSFLSLNSAGCSLGHLKAMSLYCKKIITFIFRTSHYIFFLIVAFRYQLMIKRIQNFF